MSTRLNTLVIENFRSIRGQVVIPLDAQVVLIHGTNGMGKTSVLSALELALTGRVAHLAAHGDAYKEFLTNLGQSAGSIKLTTSAPLSAGEKVVGDVSFSDHFFDADPLLNEGAARFFGERCYLPQATLGRLLEIYNDQETLTNSPLTQFVKELLGLDPLDALADGLHPAFHVTRVRNLVAEYRRTETLDTANGKEVARATQSLKSARTIAEANKIECLRLLAELGFNAGPFDTTEQVGAPQGALNACNAEQDALGSLGRVRAELRAATATWRSVPAGGVEREQATLDREAHLLGEQVSEWRAKPGVALMVILDQLRPFFPDLPGTEDGPETARATALSRASGEKKRCETLQQKAEQATQKRQALQQTIDRSTVRLAELDRALLASVDTTKSLAGALAAIVPHIHTDQCPVCDRNFRDLNAGPLSTHVAAKIADLTTEAGRLQALAIERAEVMSQLSVAQRDVLAADQELLPPLELAGLTNRVSQMSTVVEQLKALEEETVRGASLVGQAATAREAAASARRANEMSSSILPELERLVSATLGMTLGSFETIGAAIQQADDKLGAQIASAERLIATRVTALNELEKYSHSLRGIVAANSDLQLAIANQTRSTNALADANKVRDTAKGVADAAQRVRSQIVKRVFNTSLNRTWRDLFVRLAPSEDFVPKFKIPTGDKEKVEAVLETEHRTGKSSGSPGAMLSQGNLNTAALTLFLALNLSVAQRTPWLVLDDPVQSMDDLHIAQFAALLRTLSKGAGRQVVVAVHERALFDYLTLELNPAFPGDSLITIEIHRNFDGQTVARPLSHGFEDDKVVAA